MENRFVMNDKVKLILLESGLNASQFADAIDVQRSTISHILARRNRPSADVIQKITRWNPKYTFDWFMTSLPQEEAQLAKSEELLREKRAASLSSESSKRSNPLLGTAHRNVNHTDTATKASSDSNTERRIVKIMMFYSDNTYETIEPK